MEEPNLNPGPVWRQTMPPKLRHASLGLSSVTLNKETHSSGPPLPKINGDLWQEVYTHRSVARIKPHEEVGDNMRLAILGGEIMRLIVTWCLFDKKPHLSAQEIETSRDEYLSAGNIDSWVNSYNMKASVRASSLEMIQSLEGNTESCILFSSYVGAVFYQHGLDLCHRWIAHLLEPDEEPPSLPGAEPVKVEPHSSWPLPPPPPQPPLPAPPLPPSHAEGTDASSSTMSTGDGSPRSTPVPFPPPPPPFATPPPYQNAPPPATAFLPIFNQTANQRRVPVDYPAQFVGPPHAGRWQVRCVVNGEVKGEGTAASKQLAKEEAARQAYFAMGWDAKPGSMNYSRSPDYSTPGPSSRPSDLEDFDMGDSASQAGSSSSGRHQSSASQHSGRSSGPQSYPGNYPGTAPPTTAYLPMFNQTATQRRLIIDYPAEFSGPAHAGNWLVKCTVNGIVKGQGQGSSKQLAKEEAAKQAWFNMGWGR